jgi:aconitate hydratase
LFEGDKNWNGLHIPVGDRYRWDPDSTYVRRPPYFDGMPAEAPEGFEEIKGARAIALLGDSVTTDHISPAGAIKKDSPAGAYLIENGVDPRGFNSYGSRRGNHELMMHGAYLIENGVDPRGFNSYGSRRGNHELMMHGAFANIRLRNLLAAGTEGGFTTKDGDVTTIYEAAIGYADEGVPLCVLAGKEYGSGSSRDWAAKGPRLLGIRFVLAESYERIHRSNLVGMGVLPMQFPDGESAESLGLTGDESFDLAPLKQGAQTLAVSASGVSFDARVRIDTPNEWQYYRHGGILHFVLRQLAG